MAMRTVNFDKRGYALLEVCTALFIAVTALFGTFQMFQYCIDKIRVTSEYAVAGRIVENELETLRAQPFESLAVGTRNPFLSLSPELKTLPSAQVHTEIRPDAAVPSRLKEITIIVEWRTEYGRPAERHLTTLIARRGSV